MIPADQLEFIRTIQSEKIKDLADHTKGKWGVMSAQEMTEHLEDFYNVSLGRIKTALVTPEEHLPKYLEFLFSDKPFKENTKAPSSVLGEVPRPLRYASLDEARKGLSETTASFFNHFSSPEQIRTLHPVFGNLGFEEWVRLHYKHVTHHFRQFDLMG